jgi:hypothetical protein
MNMTIDLKEHLPKSLEKFVNLQRDIAKIAKDDSLMGEIEHSIKQIPSLHQLYCADSRKSTGLDENNIHLVLTSPPYWNLKKYNEIDGQMGHIDDYYKFLDELSKVWKICFDALVPGGRLINTRAMYKNRF